MKCLFFDLEYASSIDGIKICEFGYVITDESLNVITKGNFIVNPNIKRKEWDHFAVKHILTRTIEEYESYSTFPSIYKQINTLFASSDYVIGHSTSGDIKALNDECKRYKLTGINCEFFDTKIIYKAISNNERGVNGILEELGIEGDTSTHDAEADAYNTMLGLKEMMSQQKCTLQEIVNKYPNAKDYTKDFVIKSVENSNIKKVERLLHDPKTEETNLIVKHKNNWLRYLLFLDNVKPLINNSKKLINKKISISINYETNHFRQMLNLVQLITNEGGSVSLSSSRSDIFVKYDFFDENGLLMKDSRFNSVIEANEGGSNIEIIDFNEFLSILDITEKELDDMPLVSFDFLLRDEAIIKDKKLKEQIKLYKKSKPSNNTIHKATLNLGDVLQKAMNENFQKK